MTTSLSPPLARAAKHSLEFARGVVLLPLDLLRYRARRERPRPVFIVGCGNSGTSILRVILGAHPDVYATHLETGFAASQRPTQIGRASEIVRRRPLALARQHSLDASENGAAFWCEKTPRHVHSIRTLLAMDPEAAVLFISREPKDTVASLIRRGYSFDRALGRWLDDNSAGLRALKSNSRVVGLRYEDLVVAPTEVLSMVCEQTGLEYTNTMLNYSERSQQLEAPSTATRDDMAAHWRHREDQINKPLTDHRESWAETLDADAAKRVLDATQSIYAELCDEIATRFPLGKSSKPNTSRRMA